MSFFLLEQAATARRRRSATIHRACRMAAATLLEPPWAVNALRQLALTRGARPEVGEGDQVVHAVRRGRRDQAPRDRVERAEAGTGRPRPQHVREPEWVEEAEHDARRDQADLLLKHAPEERLLRDP